jgi:hypothetical protein
MPIVRGLLALQILSSLLACSDGEPAARGGAAGTGGGLADEDRTGGTDAGLAGAGSAVTTRRDDASVYDSRPDSPTPPPQPRDALAADAAAGHDGGRDLATATDAILPGGGSGLRGEYFHDTMFGARVYTQVDPVIDFNWRKTSPDPRIAFDNYSVRWTGFVEPRYSQAYSFIVDSDEGLRLWVNDTLVIDDLKTGGKERTGSIALVAGQRYPIRVDWWQGLYGGWISLYWSAPSQRREIIPASRLTPAR